MIKFIFLCSLITLSLKSSLASHIPTIESNHKHYQTDLRFWKKHKQLKPLLEFQYRNQKDQSDYKSLRLGTKYRLSKHFKTGLYYRRSYGLRHDDDWVVSNKKWFWTNTKERSEDILITEIEFLGLFPTKSQISYNFNLRYQYNTHNDHQTLKVRPGITYFANSKLAIFLRYDLYLPLNFSEENIYERWAYLGLFYKLNNFMKVGPYISKGSQAWTTSKKFEDTHEIEKYTSTHKITRVGLALNFYL